MGCDIHLHIELKHENGEWHHYGAPDVDRWYALFEKMAGVRGSLDNAISLPKGLPEDASTITKAEFEYWKDEAHSISWLSSDEIIELENWLSAFYDLEQDILHMYLNGQKITSYFKYDYSNFPVYGYTDVRFVFWFDN